MVASLVDCSWNYHAEVSTRYYLNIEGGCGFLPAPHLRKPVLNKIAAPVSERRLTTHEYGSTFRTSEEWTPLYNGLHDPNFDFEHCGCGYTRLDPVIRRGRRQQVKSGEAEIIYVQPCHAHKFLG